VKAYNVFRLIRPAGCTFVEQFIELMEQSMGEITYTYVDNSNFFIEGQRAAAVEKGMALDIFDGIERRVFDYSWQPDYGKLHTLLWGQETDRRSQTVGVPASGGQLLENGRE